MKILFIDVVIIDSVIMSNLSGFLNMRNCLESATPARSERWR